RTYAALGKQLAELDKLSGRNYREAEHDEQEWKNLTENILAHGFGEDSKNLSHFYHARSAGTHYLSGMSEQLRQQNFEKRQQAFAAVMKSSLAELELMGAGDKKTAVIEEGMPAAKAESRNVFIVHGHAETVTLLVARFLERLDLHPIILHEQPNMGRT